MQSACSSTPKPESSAIVNERDHDETAIVSSPRQEPRPQSPASVHEAAFEDVGEEETVEELETRVKEMEEINDGITKEAHKTVAKLRKIEEDMECMVCGDIIQNPQRLQCGHSACYNCLRKWWTQPVTAYDGETIIDTEAESASDTDEEVIVRQEANAEVDDPALVPEPRSRRRHRFATVVNRKKLCPYCQKQVTSRPVPDFDLRDIGETLIKEFSAVLSHAQPPRKARFTRRRDPWHGIFNPERPLPMPILAPHLEPPPPPHPDPIIHHLAQAQYRRRMEEIVARRDRERAEAYEDGRMRGLREARLRPERYAQARQGALDRPLQGRLLGPSNPSNLQAAEVANVVEIAEDFAPALGNNAAAL